MEVAVMSELELDIRITGDVASAADAIAPLFEQQGLYHNAFHVEGTRRRPAWHSSRVICAQKLVAARFSGSSHTPVPTITRFFLLGDDKAVPFSIACLPLG